MDILEKINSLNDSQKEAVLKTEGPLLLLAGAGSGKTRVLTHRIAYLIQKGVSPFNILAITFTNKAAREMRERVENITNLGKEVWVSTFHSTCVKILRRDIHKIGYTNQFTIYDAEDSEKVIKEICKEFKINDEILPPKSIIFEISNQKDKLIDATTYSQNVNDFRKKMIADVYIAYENRLKSNNALDFDDIILKTVQLFASNIDVLEKYQERFKYIMVDEYQDTSTCQYTLIKLLANKYQNICVVGDDDQSIYGWRGADINNILNFEKDFENTTVIKLEQNYRSTKIILNTANEVIKNNFGRKDKTLWTQNIDGELITYNKCNSDKEEASFIAKTIMENFNKNNRAYKDFAILYRTNNLSRLVEECLVKNSIPYKLYGGVNFYGRKEIKDVISYLKVLVNPNDDISLKRIINIPKRGIGETTINKINEYAVKNNISFFAALNELDNINISSKTINSLLKFLNIILELMELDKNQNMADFIENVLEKTLYIEELKKEGTDEALNRIENITELINKAIEFEENFDNKNPADYDDYQQTKLSKFLEDIALVADIDSMENSENVVTLMTLHSSKGLEFPIVFIIGFEEGIFPSYRAITSPNFSEVEEERRLLYVGITRAKEQLFITSTKTRLRNGRFVNNAVSSFFKEIPKKFLNIIPQKEKNNNKLTENISVDKNKTTKYKPNIPYLKKDIPIPKNITIDFKIGDTIKHFKFGNGTVLEIEPAGADFEVKVDFENFGIKKVMANLSKLKKV